MQAANVAPAGNNPPPVIYATSPYASTTVVDYTTKEGAKLYLSAIAPIEPKYSGDPTELAVFLERLAIKGETFGWTNTIFAVDVGTAAAPSIKNLTSEHGQISFEHCRDKAQAFFNTPNINLETQSSRLLYVCLAGSLTPSFCKKLNLKKTRYTIEGRGGVKECDGAMMLKVMLEVVLVTTKSTVSIIRLQLQNLPAKMKEMDSNVEAFSEFVKTQMIALATRGEPTADLLVSLFAGYGEASDETFKRWITDVEVQYEDGKWNDLTPDQLMDMADSRYKTMVEKKKWKAPSTTQNDMVILRAEVRAEVEAALQPAIERANGNPKIPRNARTSTNRYTGVHKWKTIAPKAGESHEKTVGKREYVYCPNHKELKWVLKEGHSKGCTLAPEVVTTTQKKKKKGGASQEKQYAEALAHIHDGEYEEESEEEDDNV